MRTPIKHHVPDRVERFKNDGRRRRRKLVTRAAVEQVESEAQYYNKC